MRWLVYYEHKFHDNWSLSFTSIIADSAEQAIAIFNASSVLFYAVEAEAEES